MNLKSGKSTVALDKHIELAYMEGVIECEDM